MNHLAEKDVDIADIEFAQKALDSLWELDSDVVFGAGFHEHQATATYILVT